MDRTRMDELQQKARAIGLSDLEADELGRLLAESQGRPYSNAAEEHPAVLAESNAGRERAEGLIRLMRRRVSRRPLASTRSLEIGQASAPPEDAERQDETHALSRH